MWLETEKNQWQSSLNILENLDMFFNHIFSVDYKCNWADILIGTVFDKDKIQKQTFTTYSPITHTHTHTHTHQLPAREKNENNRKQQLERRQEQQGQQTECMSPPLFVFSHGIWLSEYRLVIDTHQHIYIQRTVSWSSKQADRREDKKIKWKWYVIYKT